MYRFFAYDSLYMLCCLLSQALSRLQEEASINFSGKKNGEFLEDTGQALRCGISKFRLLADDEDDCRRRCFSKASVSSSYNLCNFVVVNMIECRLHITFVILWM